MKCFAAPITAQVYFYTDIHFIALFVENTVFLNPVQSIPDQVHKSEAINVENNPL